MMKLYKKINLQEPQRNRNANANFVNLIRTSTVPWGFYSREYGMVRFSQATLIASLLSTYPVGAVLINDTLSTN